LTLRKISELPCGINNLVVSVHERDVGSLIAYTLLSETYVAELQCQVNGSFDLKNELDYRTEESVPDNCKVKQNLEQRLLILSSDSNQRHIYHEFPLESGGDEVRCVTYFAAQFHTLRSLCKPGNLAFLESICKSARWETTGGKSGALFSMVC